MRRLLCQALSILLIILAAFPHSGRSSRVQLWPVRDVGQKEWPQNKEEERQSERGRRRSKVELMSRQR